MSARYCQLFFAFGMIIVGLNALIVLITNQEMRMSEGARGGRRERGRLYRCSYETSTLLCPHSKGPSTNRCRTPFADLFHDGVHPLPPPSRTNMGKYKI